MKPLTTTVLLAAFACACGSEADSSDDTKKAAEQDRDDRMAAADEQQGDDEPPGSTPDESEVADEDREPASDDEAGEGDEADAEEISSGSGSTSLGAPAPCASDEDCPDGIECTKLEDSDELGFCNVDEAVVSDEPMDDAEEIPVESDEGAPDEVNSGGGVSLATPVMCQTGAECPPGIECVKFDAADPFGHCDVSEVSVE